MADKKMTKMDFFQAIVEDENISVDLKEFAQEEIEKIVKANERAKERRAEQGGDKDNEAREAIETVFATELTTVVEDEEGNKTLVVISSEAAEILGVSPQKANAMLKRGVRMGLLTEFDKVKGNKGRNVKGYAQVQTEE